MSQGFGKSEIKTNTNFLIQHRETLKKLKKNIYQVTLYDLVISNQFQNSEFKKVSSGIFEVHRSLDRRPIFQMSKEK